MNETITGLAMLTQFLRTALLAGGVALAGVAVVDWAVRTRRINPFNGVARFMRARIEPRLAGVERQVTRVGGHPSSTPWWALVVYVVCAALLLGAVDMIVSLVLEVEAASSLGALGVLVLAVRWTFGILRLALLVRVVASWVPSLRSRRWIAWSYGATEWMLRPLRRLIPTFGVMDVTPLVAYFALQLAQRLVEAILLAGAR
jgi:YggT family protein